MRGTLALRIDACLQIGLTHLALECGLCHRTGEIAIADIPGPRWRQLGDLGIRCDKARGGCGCERGAIEIRPFTRRPAATA